MKKVMLSGTFLILLVLIKPPVYPHCEVPCGIYNDEMRFTMIEEHIATIEKAMQEMAKLSKENSQNMNQIVRWIMNKEHHAEEIQHIVSQYFMTQRLKLVDKNDEENFNFLTVHLILCHQILVYAMKTKQTDDLEAVTDLKKAVGEFKAAYFKGHKH